jgi:hypothetical protein
VPEIWPEYVEWDHNNLGYSTRRVSQREIDQVIANVPTYRVNRLGRAGNLVASGKRTAAGAWSWLWCGSPTFAVSDRSTHGRTDEPARAGCPYDDRRAAC